MVITTLLQVMIRLWNNCLWTWIGKGNVLLHVQLLWPIHLTCSMPMCRNPSLGLTTKAKRCKVAGQEGSLKIMSHAPESARV